MQRIIRARLLLIIFCASYTILLPTRTSSRYMPFLETPDEYIVKESVSIRPTALVSYADDGYKRNHDGGTLIDLWGTYNLHSITNGLTYVYASQGRTYTNPFQSYYPGGGTGWLDSTTNETKDLVFGVIGKIKVKGVTLSATIPIQENFYCGAWLPFFHVNASYRYELDTERSHGVFSSLKPGEKVALDSAHQQVHADLGLRGNMYQKTGSGDLDLFAGYQDKRAYWLRMREAVYGVRIGMLIPTSSERDTNYPSAVPLMGNKHFSLYGDAYVSAELKYNLRVGGVLGYRLGFSGHEERRIGTLDEPDNFGPLVITARVTPPSTFKGSSFVTLENIMDGVHVQGRYSYLLFSHEKISDVRGATVPQTYLSRTPAGTVTQSAIDTARHDKQRLASGRSHYVSVSLCYDPAQALMNWPTDPIFFINYDYCIGGAAVAKTHQLTLGATLQF